MAQFNANQFRDQMRRMEQQLRNAQRQAEQEARRRAQAINDYNRKVNEHNRDVVRQINDHNRRAAEHNRRLAQEVDAHNRSVVTYNREVDAQNQRTLSALRSARSALRYTPQENELVERLRDAIEVLPVPREYDVFLSYARIDGAETALALRNDL